MSVQLVAKAKPGTLPPLKQADTKSANDMHAKFALTVLEVQPHAIKLDMHRFSQWIEENKKYLFALPKTNTSGTLVKTDSFKNKLFRSLFVTIDKKIFILFNKVSKLKDIVIGSGGSKKAKYALEFDTRTWNVLASMDEESYEEETKGQNLVKDLHLPGMLTFKYSFSYISKKKEKNNQPVKRFRTITEKMQVLSSFLKIQGCSLSLDGRHNLILQISEHVEALHSHDLIHRDLKSNNIVVNSAGKCFIIDFQGTRQISDQSDLSVDRTTYTVAPPESLAKKVEKDKAKRMAQSQKEAQAKNVSFVSVNKKSLDIWSLGCVAYEILHQKSPPWIQFERSDGDNPTYIQRQIKEKIPYLLAANEGWIERSIRQMLVIDPEKRLTIVQLKELKKYNESIDKIVKSIAGTHHKINSFELHEFLLWIDQKQEQLINLPPTDSQGTFVRYIDNKKLFRSLFISLDGNIFILFSKISQMGDLVARKDQSKIVKFALNYTTREWFFLGSMHGDYFGKEMKGQKLVENLLGKIATVYSFSYLSKRKDPDGNPIKKFRTLTPYFPSVNEYVRRKDLDYALTHRHKAILHLFQYIIALHKQEIVYSGLKSENILVDQNQRCRIGDFYGVRKMSDPNIWWPVYISDHAAPPEYSTIYVNKLQKEKDTDIICQRDGYKSIEMWSLGCVAYELLHKAQVPWVSKNLNLSTLNYHQAMIAQARTKEGFSYPVTSKECWIDRAIRQMFEMDPSKRLTAIQLEEVMNKMQPTPPSTSIKK